MELHITAFNNSTEIPVADNIIPLCELAKNLAEAGEFESACETLRPFWRGLLHRPETNGLAEDCKAELLLRAGTLTGWVGSAKQIAGAQEAAKDLISESASIFETLRNTEKIAEARVDLAICYWREGALDEARVTLRLVLESLGAVRSEQKLRALLNSAIVEKVATRDHDALSICTESAPLFASSSNDALRGKFHNTYAAVLRSVGTSENREDYIDRALLEYAAASYHFEQAGHKRFQARVENNVGYLFATIGRFAEAQEHLAYSRSLSLNIGDRASAAGAEDSCAQAFILEGKYDLAEKAARSAVYSLKQGGEQAMLAEALTTHGKALARLKQMPVAKAVLDQAVEISQTAGNKI